jgi:transposase InsO family protein
MAFFASLSPSFSIAEADTGMLSDAEKHVNTHYIDPGSPWQNAYCESFNSIFGTTCLDRCLFGSMTEARVIIDNWLDEYNTVRPHGSLGGMTPEKLLQRWTEANIDQQPKSLTG